MGIQHCKDCKYIWKKPGIKCDAFPDGIPFAIQSGEFNHKKTFPDQGNDVVFEPIEE